MTDAPMLIFDNSYARLPDQFYVRQAPARRAEGRVLAFSPEVARLLGADPEKLHERIGPIAVGLDAPAGMDSLAMAYAGHQFGHFSPQLGDGRAVLLGEVIGPDGVRRDLHLKGSGRTAFSRGGDGNCALGPALREFILAEAMAALGVPTTRSLAVVATGEHVYRNEGPRPGAVLARVASSHIRVGTFQYFAAQNDVDALAALFDHAARRHYPEALTADIPPLAFLRGVMARQADLIAAWMSFGFIHGVMNTDNMAISGETIDYGPCAFMDAYHSGRVYSSIDRQGRYAFGNQPQMALWNLARLADALLALMADAPEDAIPLAEQALADFAPMYEAAWLRRMGAKLGLEFAQDDDGRLALDLLKIMAESEADFTLAFRALCRAETDDAAFLHQFADPAAAAAWLQRWRLRLQAERRANADRAAAMRTVNPCYIPRNHQVERALNAAVDTGDLEPFHRLNAVLARPFDDQPDAAAYAGPPAPGEEIAATFCGT